MREDFGLEIFNLKLECSIDCLRTSLASEIDLELENCIAIWKQPLI